MINFSSDAGGVLTAGGGASYCTSKAGVVMLTKVGAMEMAPHKVRVNVISPGHSDTPFNKALFANAVLTAGFVKNIPLGRTGVAEDLAPACFYLASDESSWVTGHNLIVDGGMHMMRIPIASDFVDISK